MVYLHILGSGKTKSETANSKGHLFERLMAALFDHLNMSVTRMNKSENGLEIDIEGETIFGKVKFFAECKAREDALDSSDIQKFGFKFQDKIFEQPDTRGFLFTLSTLNSKAQELWDAKLQNRYGERVTCHREQDIISHLIKHHKLASPDVIRHHAATSFRRACGDTQLLCVENTNREPSLCWAQLLMSTDGTEPNLVVFYSAQGDVISEVSFIERLLALKPDLSTAKLTCLNLERSTSGLSGPDDVSPARRVVRVRMSKSWFDYRFPAAPPFFVGRNEQRGDLLKFIRDVREGKTGARGVVFTGKSGIGKSSLALKAREELEKQKVIFLPIDCRLCDDVGFLFDSIIELLLELRQVPELNTLLDNVRVEGLDSLIETLTGMHEALTKHGYLATLFFDQFEKVFECPDVAKSIRTLFLRVTEKQLAILFGFAWKSDLWSMAEGFPHQERDDIVREAFALKQLGQFGQEETNEILKQLEVHWNSRLSTQLHKQLAIFSRGLPWLLKKVCAHVLDQHERGVTQNELVETNLKLQDLFEADLAGLDDEERTLLRAIAPMLPATLRRLSESFEISNIDQSLYRFIDKRILVKITEDVADSPGNVKYDAYSDIFREFLITGRVPIDDAYYFYMYPRGVLKFFEKIKQRGTLSIEQEIEETGRQIPSIYNLSRDLRSLGLVNVRNKVFALTDEVVNLDQDQILSFLQSQLKRNRVVSSTLAELNDNETVSLARVAELLQELFPSVQAMEKTWDHYTRTLASWLHEAKLAYYDNRHRSLRRADNEALFEAVVEGGGQPTIGFRFPMCFRNSVVEYLELMHKMGGTASIQQLMETTYKAHQSIEKVLSDILNLQLASHQGDGVYSLTPVGIRFVESQAQDRRQIFRQQCEAFPVFNQFMAHIKAAGMTGISGIDGAQQLVREMQLNLADATVEKLGGILGNWAEYAGLITRYRRLCLMKEYSPEQMMLFE